VSTACIDLFDSLSPPPLTNAAVYSLLLLPGAYEVAFLVSVTYFAMLEWKDWLSRELLTSFFLFVSTVCIDLFDSQSLPPLTNAVGYSLLLSPGAYGVAFLLSVTYFAALEWKDWMSRELFTSSLVR
jgi:hypothetical protein